MFRFSALLRRCTATTFLVAFLGVFAGQCFCAGRGTSCAAPKSSRALPTCCMSGGTCHMPGMSKAGDSDKQQPDGGCQTHTAAFFASLAGPPAVGMTPAAPLWLSQPPLLDFAFARFTGWAPAQAVVLVPARQLKPKIPDVRVFIQSLTI